MTRYASPRHASTRGSPSHRSLDKSSCEVIQVLEVGSYVGAWRRLRADDGLTGCYSGREVRQERRLRLLRGNRLSAREPISQIIAQLLVRSWDNGWDNRRGSTRDRIALKRRQRNDLVGFELFLRSQTLYPTELRARSKTLHSQQFTASSSSISTSSFGSFGALVRIRWMRYLSHAKQFK